MCRRNASRRPDPLVTVLPRYILGNCTSGVRTVYQLPIQIDNQSFAHLLYYSSGDILQQQQFDLILVVVHGAGRNADDYYCSVLAVAQRQEQSVLVVAPRFPIATEASDAATLVWKDDNGAGPWRYGANAVSHPVSSFAVMDQLLQVVSAHCRRLILVGHSSGGQFVQRYTMITPHWSDFQQAVVANPSSHAYLTPQRYLPSDAGFEWRLPTAAEHATCPTYHAWHWGLNMSNQASSYVRQVLTSWSPHDLLHRFLSRTVWYWIGSRDRCNVTGLNHDDWCFSHGLENACGDQMQGLHRWARHYRYFDSLRQSAGAINQDDCLGQHCRLVVRGVGHDHSLMFNSPEAWSIFYHGMSSEHVTQS
jgi:pimeloyl-ACP methyl ester carboxylesterase